jgi:hypothetical protein
VKKRLYNCPAGILSKTMKESELGKQFTSQHSHNGFKIEELKEIPALQVREGVDSGRESCGWRQQLPATRHPDRGVRREMGVCKSLPNDIIAIVLVLTDSSATAERLESQ